MTGLQESVTEGVNKDGQGSLVIRCVSRATMVRSVSNNAASTVTLPHSVIKLQDNVKVDVNQVGQETRVITNV